MTVKEPKAYTGESSTALIVSIIFVSVNVRDAGEGTLEIGISSPTGQNIANNVVPMGTGMFLVSFTPTVGGVHKATITFNDENIRGIHQKSFKLKVAETSFNDNFCKYFPSFRPFLLIDIRTCLLLFYKLLMFALY